MKALVNLAQSPFRNRRLFWLSVLGLFVGASWFGLAALERLNKLEQQIAGREDQVILLEAKSKKTETAKPVSNITITADKNHELLAAADLIERRAFSWSQLLNAIERHIPPTVRVFRIAVNKVRAKEQAGVVSEEDRTVSLTLEVMGKTVGDVTNMMTGFERSGAFIVNPREKKVMDETGEVAFILEVEYTPPLRAPRALNNQIAETSLVKGQALGSSVAPVKLVSLR